MPSDLQLSLGYFACKMRGPSESTLTVREGFGAEDAYFDGHAVYGRRSSSTLAERLGVPHLSSFLSRVLLQHLRQHLPKILHEVMLLYTATER